MFRNHSRADTALYLCVAVLLALLLFWGLGDIALVSFNEARRSVVVREMLVAHDWLIPTMNGEPYLIKPPLFYWLALTVSELAGGVSEWTTRFPSAVFGAVSCLWAYWFGARLCNRRVGILAAIFTLANAGFSLHARSAEVEMTLSGLCVSSLMIAAYFLFSPRPGTDSGKRWVLLSYAFIGLAVLTKGPVSFLFTALPVVVFWLLERNSRARVYVTSIRGWLLAVLIGSSWFLAVSLREGFGVWQAIIQHDIAGKMASGRTADPWYSYFAYMLGDFFPFWIILFIRPKQLWQQIRMRSDMKFLACATLVPLLVLSCFSAKNPKYLLPMYPWLAVLLAVHWDQILTSVSGWRRRAMVAIPVIMLVGFVIFYLFAEQRVLAHRVLALPQISAAVAGNQDWPIYHLGEPDMRLVFYAGKPVKALGAEQVPALATPAWLFATSPVPAALQVLSPCIAERFKPYLSKRDELVLYRLDGTCGSSGVSPD